MNKQHLSNPTSPMQTPTSPDAMLDRRTWLGQLGQVGGGALMTAALSQLAAAEETSNGTASKGQPGVPHFAGKAKRVIYLFQSVHNDCSVIRTVQALVSLH